MPNELSSECLARISVSENETLTEVKQNELKQKIKNYANFYNGKFQVPHGEIFYSGVVSATMLKALCENDNYIRIYIAKNSNNNLIIDDFTFIIMNANAEGLTVFDGASPASTDVMDICCCRNPPPNTNAL